jgi:uncharacterized FlaG/YvyC family protein
MMVTPLNSPIQTSLNQQQQQQLQKQKQERTTTTTTATKITTNKTTRLKLNCTVKIEHTLQYLKW